MISIGNLAVGGRAKTPMAALVAERLLARGERPSILSRGYARRDAADGVVVVRDPGGIRADLDRAGDEPLMLARRLDGAAVLVSSSRYLAGVLAERHFGCTVHVLDDGFQHFDLHRDADLVAIAAADIGGEKTLPFGRLREPVEAAAAADAFVLLDDVPREHFPRGKPLWRATAVQSPPTTDEPVLALAGIADPDRFFNGLKTNGWRLVSMLRYTDHHRYRPLDMEAIYSRARGERASRIVTTEKDLVRLLPFRPFAVPIEAVALSLHLDDSGTFDTWLAGALEKARA